MRLIGTFGCKICNKCQEILSPSRSSSVARISSLTPFSADLSSRTIFFLSSGTMYSGSKSASTFTPSFAHSVPLRSAGISLADCGKSRTCPIDASTRYPAGKKFRMVRAFVGDSTMTRVDILACKVRGNQKKLEDQ